VLVSVAFVYFALHCLVKLLPIMNCSSKINDLDEGIEDIGDRLIDTIFHRVPYVISILYRPYIDNS
jgi:hypothetical protein